jgi:hypothetical protein
MMTVFFSFKGQGFLVTSLGSQEHSLEKKYPNGGIKILPLGDAAASSPEYSASHKQRVREREQEDTGNNYSRSISVSKA